MIIDLLSFILGVFVGILVTGIVVARTLQKLLDEPEEETCPRCKNAMPVRYGIGICRDCWEKEHLTKEGQP